MKEVINIKNVSKYFGKFKALDNVNLNVLRGQMKIVALSPSKVLVYAEQSLELHA